MTEESSTVHDRLSLVVMLAPLALVRLAAEEVVPGWAAQAQSFLSITRTPYELSIVVDERAVPPHVQAARKYRALRVEGPLPLELVGVLAAVAGPLAAAGVPIFAIATFDTDYILVRQGVLAHAVTTLRMAGHTVRGEASAEPVP